MERDRRRPSLLGSVARLATAALLTGGVLINGGLWLYARSMTHMRPSSPPVAAAGVMTVWLAGGAMARPRNRLSPRDHGLSFSTHQVQLADGDTLEGWLIPHPNPRGIIAMFHGHAAAKESVLPQAAVFHRLGFDLFLVDFRGSGGSSGDTTTLGHREAEDVAATVAFIHQTWPERPLVLYGVSMGAAAVLRAMATTDLQPAALLLESPYDRLVTTVGRRIAASGAPAWPLAEMLVFWGGVQVGINGFDLNPVEHAAAVRAPTLLLHGGQDPWVTAEDSDAIVARLAGPRQLVRFPAARHEALVLAAPAPWQAAVATFLDQYTPARHAE
jgi:alpha-beta hydrolase superfamily lysophospholipase